MTVILYNAANGETVTGDNAEGYDPAEWTEVSAPPATGAWVYDGTGWVAFPIRTLEQVKDAAKDAVERARDATMNGGAPVTVGVIDSDQQSRLFVAGSVSMAQIALAASQPFTIRWRLADNSYADLDAAGMIGMGVELGQFVNACCQTGFDLKDQIDGAEDAQEVAAIDIAAAFALLSTPAPDTSSPIV